jgi:hypothetical protein
MKKFMFYCLALAVAVLPAAVKAGPPIGAKDDGGVDAVVSPEDSQEVRTLPPPVAKMPPVALPAETRNVRIAPVPTANVPPMVMTADTKDTKISAAPAGKPPVVLLPADTHAVRVVPAPECAPAACAAPSPAPCRDGFMGFAEYLYWSVHNSNVPFAQPFDGVDPFTSVPRGPVAQVSPRFESGFRVGAGVAVGDCGWLVGTYTNFRNTTGAAITAPDGFVLHSNLAFPNTVNSSGDSLNASAVMSIDLQMGDLDYKWNFLKGEHLSLSFISGGRFAHLDQKMLATYELTGTTYISPNIYFDGGGPRTGLEGEYRISHGFYGYGKGTANLLVGEFSGSYVERNIFTGLVGNTSFRDDRVVPVLELELGFGWQSESGRVRVSAGYYVGSWFNAMTIPTLANSIQNNNFTRNANNNQDTLTFDGLVGKIEFRF